MFNIQKGQFLVKKGNEMIRARTDILDITTSRIISSLIAQIEVKEKFDKKKVYSIALKDFISFDAGKEYAVAKKAFDQLLHMHFYVLDESRSTGAKKYFLGRPFFKQVEYKDGILSVIFNELASSNLFDLSQNYTSYDLAELLSIPTLYSQKLFEYLKSWQNVKQGFVDIDIDELHNFLCVPKSLKSNFKNFRIRVLETAEKHLKNTSCAFCWEPLTRGQGGGVYAIKFSFIRRSEFSKMSSDLTVDQFIESGKYLSKTLENWQVESLLNDEKGASEKFEKLANCFTMSDDLQKSCAKKIWALLPYQYGIKRPLYKDAKNSDYKDIEAFLKAWLADSKHALKQNERLNYALRINKLVAPKAPKKMTKLEGKIKLGNLLQSMVSGKRIAS